MMQNSFIFGGSTGRTHEDIKRMRQRANAVRPNLQVRGGIAGFGEGLSTLGRALMHRVMSDKADKMEQEGRTEFNEQFGTIFGQPQPSGQQETQVASLDPSAIGGSVPATPEQPRQQLGTFGGVDPRLVQLAGNPHATPGQQALMQLMLKRQMDASAPMDPLEQLQIEREQFELDRLRNPQADPMKDIQLQKARLELQQMQNPDRRIIEGRDGFKYYQDTGERVLPNVQGPAGPDFNLLSPEQAQQLGLPGGSFQQGPDGRISQIGNAGTNVSVNTQAETELQKARGKGLAGRLNGIADDGVKALDDLSTINRLGDLLSGVETGGSLPAFKGELARITGYEYDDSVSDIQAVQSLVDYMTPRMRVAGSGSSSDKDIETFKSALPGLMNTPEGNQRITQTLGGMAQRRAELGEIAVQWQLGEISAADAHRMMRELPNPFEAFANQDANKTKPDDGVVSFEEYFKD